MKISKMMVTLWLSDDLVFANKRTLRTKVYCQQNVHGLNTIYRQR